MEFGMRLFVPASIALLAAYAFAPVVPGGGYVFDDHVLIERNSDLQRSDVWFASWGRDYYATSQGPGGSGYYRPIAVLCNAFDVHVWRSGARGAHLTNIVLHVLTSLAVLPALRAIGATAAAAWVVALFFAAHPVHAESVAFISGRVDVLAALFLLLTMSAAALRWRFAWLLVGAGAFLALTSKEIAVVLPVLLFLVWRAQKSRDRRRSAWPRSQIVAVGVALLLVLLLRYNALGALLPATAGNVRPQGAALLPLQTILFALATVFAPIQRIAMEPHPTTLQVLRLGIGALVFLGMSFLAWRVDRTTRDFQRRAAIAGAAALLPVLNVLPQETLLSERFLYLASVFLLVPVGILVLVAWRHHTATRTVAVTTATVALALLLGISSWRAEIWRDDVRLWRRAVHEEPERAAFWDRLGLALTERRAFSEAEVAVRRAVALDPGLFNAQHNLGVLLHSTRRYPEAVVAYQEAVRLQPRNVRARVNLGRALTATRELEAAYASYAAALEIKHDHVEANRLAGTTALALGRFDDARRHLELARRLSPGDPRVQQALEKLRRVEQRQGGGSDG